MMDMSTLALVLMAGILAIGVYFVLTIQRELAAIRNVLERMVEARPPVTYNPVGIHTTKATNTAAAYSIWVYKGRLWKLDQTSVPAGYVAGDPPAFAGSFEGQRVKTECRSC